MKKISLLVGLLALALLSTGCSSVSTGPDQVALHYEGGSFSAKKFKECVAVSSRQYDGPSDKHYTYPANQRVFDFTGANNSDAKPVKIASKDTIEMTVAGVVQFTLNTECKVLREFHEKIGNRNTAYFEDAAEPSNGWKRVLEQYIGRQIDATLDREALAYNWRDIYANPQVKVQLEKSVSEQLQSLVDRATDGESQFFNILSVQIQKPEPPQELLGALRDEQTKVAQANAARAQAEAQIAQAQAEARVALEQAKKRQNEIKGYGSVEEYNKAQCIAAGCNPYQATYVVPQGGPK